jgi:hypothetical protein
MITQTAIRATSSQNASPPTRKSLEEGCAVEKASSAHTGLESLGRERIFGMPLVGVDLRFTSLFLKSNVGRSG